MTRIKAPDGEFQPSVEVYLHISTEKLALVNIDNKEPIIEHPLRTISYIADIANIIVIMARRIPAFNSNSAQNEDVDDASTSAQGTESNGSSGSSPPYAESYGDSYAGAQHADDLVKSKLNLDSFSIICGSASV